jgi:hypothetical protein
MPAVRKAKEYLTGRVTQGVTDRFREAIPTGFGFGSALEVVLQAFIDLPEELRIKLLTGQIQAQDTVKALALWESLPEEYRTKWASGEAPDLIHLIEQIVDEKIAAGREAGKHFAAPPKRKPGAAGSRSRSDGNHGR